MDGCMGESSRDQRSVHRQNAGGVDQYRYGEASHRSKPLLHACSLPEDTAQTDMQAMPAQPHMLMLHRIH